MSYLDYITNDFARGWVASKSEIRDGVHVPLVYIDINDGYLHDAILFAQIMYWHEPNKETGQSRLTQELDGHLWIAKNHNEWYKECRVQERMVRKSLDRIKERGLIFYEVHGFAGKKTPLIRVNWEAFAEKVQACNKSQSDTTCQDNSTQHVSQSDTMCQTNSTQHVEPNTETTTESLLGDRNTPVVIAPHQTTTPSARMPRPRRSIQNQPVEESTGRTDVRSDLEELIHATFKTYPGGTNKKKLNKNLPLLNENTKEMEDEPTPIDRFDADPEFRVYCQGQIDYWYKRAKGEGQPPRSFMKLLVDSLYFVNGDYGYFKWLHNKGKPMPTEEDAPVEGWSF